MSLSKLLRPQAICRTKQNGNHSQLLKLNTARFLRLVPSVLVADQLNRADIVYISGLSLDHQTVSAASRIRLSEREEESMSCFLRACDAALSYLQDLDKVSLETHRFDNSFKICIVLWQTEAPLTGTWWPTIQCVFNDSACHHNPRTVLSVCCFFPDSDDSTPQNSQIEPAPCGHGAGLLRAGCITECLPLSAAEGVTRQTTQKTYKLFSYLFSLPIHSIFIEKNITFEVLAIFCLKSLKHW